MLVAPSPVPWSPAHATPREMTRDDMVRVREEFVAATRMAARAGFDMVELHAAHGYLVSSFISPLSNQRTDEWGGSLDNRLRWPLEVFAAMRAAWPTEKPMAVRISASDWVGPGGVTPDEAVAIARAFHAAGADIIDVSAGQTSTMAQPVYGRMFQTPFSDRIRNETGIATMAVGNITDSDQVNSILMAGRADLVCLARPHLADPYWTLHAAVGLNDRHVDWPRPYHAGSRSGVPSRRAAAGGDARMTFDGRRVLITGGGTGSGADLARGFSAAGAEVIIAGRRAAPLDLVAARHPRVRAVVADVTSETSVSALFAAAGPCDIVIANAGSAVSAPAARTTLDDLRAMLDVNLVGVFLTFREALKTMGPGGRLIAVASIAGLKGVAYASAYAAAKHGAVGLVRSLALEVAKKRITVNAICPGFLDTEMTERTLATIMQTTGRSREQALAALTAASPQGRLMRVDEVTAAALWLASPGADGVNGQAIPITGGEA